MSNVLTNNPMDGKASRTTMVWGAFIMAMTLVGGVLVLTDPNPAPDLHSGRSLAGLLPSAVDSKRTVIDTDQAIDSTRWNEIIIEDSGQPHGSVESITRNAQAHGSQGFPQHFLIGNGNGMGDGDLHLSYRWNNQQIAQPIKILTSQSDQADAHDGAVRICLVGNLENRPFTTSQLDRLAALIAGLQQELNIPITHVRFQTDYEVDSQIANPNFDQQAFYALLAKAGNPGS